MSQDVRHEHTAYSLHLLYHALDRDGDKCGVDLFVGSFLLVIKQTNRVRLHWHQQEILLQIGKNHSM